MGCENGVSWIYKAFGECVVTGRDNASFYLGLLSTIISLISSSPQIIQNVKSKSVAGQSPFFFSLLLTGSIASFVGLLVNGGLVTQVIQAIVFVILDGILVVQYIYYKYMYTKCHSKPDTDSLDNEESKKIPAAVVSVAAAAAIDYAIPYTGKELAGTIFGWISAIIYCSSRIPQLYKNFLNSKVGDINPLYIMFSFLGNFSYCLSIFVKSLEAQWCWNQTPWIIGAAGPCLCDIIIMIQMCIYGIESTASDEHSDEDEVSVIPEL